MIWTRTVKNNRGLLTNPSLIFVYQTNTFKLLCYNYFVVLLIANQEVAWNYRFKDTELANRYGREQFEPQVLPKFGFYFRVLTVIMNTLAMATLLEPTRTKRNYLLPCIIWNFYTIAAVTENIIEIIWSMCQLEVPFQQFISIIILGLFMVAFQSKLTIQVIQFYEYLNYAYD